ncbi:MAG: nucleoside-diphosphate kinase [Treponema sp.]|nr:nucleoside-diphosphate kinase [Treponema sp.]
MERSFVMLKPGVLNRRICGEVISRLEKRGLNLVAVKLLKISKETAQTHYKEHIGKPFYEGLIEYTISAPVVAMVWEGDNAIMQIRKTAGATNIEDSLPGTIRGDYCLRTQHNIIHASDTVKSAEREISLFFSPDEIISWTDESAHWF